ncbi:hypothetical protein TSAR_012000 [Trichomalopsis sarcophagae]|uniref:Uncharacterized protein n=1 Tax=Trichomalopsis sarcophagae TaxID=543379 RepID=A0A232ER73_9HYME|nr:hypothetical protein TSAR_012000 [Trichomalopsis sarcophagae]
MAHGGNNIRMFSEKNNELFAKEAGDNMHCAELINPPDTVEHQKQEEVSSDDTSNILINEVEAIEESDCNAHSSMNSTSKEIFNILTCAPIPDSSSKTVHERNFDFEKCSNFKDYEEETDKSSDVENSGTFFEQNYVNVKTLPYENIQEENEDYNYNKNGLSDTNVSNHIDIEHNSYENVAISPQNDQTTSLVEIEHQQITKKEPSYNH